MLSHLDRHLDENPTRVVCRLLLLPLIIINLTLVVILSHLLIIVQVQTRLLVSTFTFMLFRK